MPAGRGPILERFRKKLASGAGLLGAAAQDAAGVRAFEAAGADFVVVTRSGRFADGGRGVLAGMLPLSDTNSDIQAIAPEVVGAARAIPVLAGVCGTDPLRLMDKFLADLQAAGFAGVQNVPTVGILDGGLRTNLEETHLGYEREVEMIRLARGLDLLTTALALTPDEAARMARAGADLVIVHLGLPTERKPSEADTKRIQEVAEAARGARRDVIVLAHGGPLSKPASMKGIDGLHDVQKP